jgi:hypothetical protein
VSSAELTSALILSLISMRGPFLKLERIDGSRCAADGVVTLAIAEVTLEGVWVDATASEYRLIVDGANLAAAPKLALPFEKSSTPLSVAIVLQANLPFRGDMESIAGAVRAFVRELPPRAQVSLTTYGKGVKRVASPRPPAELAAVLADFSASDSAESPALDAFGAALIDLGPLDPSHRRLLVVVSDGVSDGADPEAVKAFANLAKSRGVPVHPIAFSATDERAPMLGLGEIAKRSNGTFRWAKTAKDLEQELANLAREIGRQLQLEFELEDHCEKPHRVAVSRGTLRSNEKGTAASVGGSSPILWIAIAVGALVVVGAVALLVKRFR